MRWPTKEDRSAPAVVSRVSAASVMQVEARHGSGFIPAIERMGLACAKARICMGRHVGVTVAGVEEVIEVHHVGSHVAGPFQHLGANVDQESIGGPAAEDHDLGRGMVVEEESHGSARSNGLGANVGG